MILYFLLWKATYGLSESFLKIYESIKRFCPDNIMEIGQWRKELLITVISKEILRSKDPVFYSLAHFISYIKSQIKTANLYFENFNREIKTVNLYFQNFPDQKKSRLQNKAGGKIRVDVLFKTVNNFCISLCIIFVWIYKHYFARLIDSDLICFWKKEILVTYFFLTNIFFSDSRSCSWNFSGLLVPFKLLFSFQGLEVS